MEIGGQVERGFEPVRAAFASVLRQQRGAGAAVAAWSDGVWLADLWGGWADAARTRRWQRDTLVQPYSVSKPFAAMGVLLLADRGLVELDAPAQHYWPQLRARATVRQLLSHQAGVVALDEPAPTEVFYDWDRLCALLAAQEPAWEPGTAHGESALFYGHLVGEACAARRRPRALGGSCGRRSAARRASTSISGSPPREQARAADLTGLDERFVHENMAGKPALYARAVGNPPGCQDPAVVNGRAWRGAEIPAINGHGTARAVAGLYAALLGGQLLSAGLLREATTAQCSGVDAVYGHDNAWGLGFGVDADEFGMGGLGGSYAGAITAGGYTFGFVTAAMGDHARATEIENALRACLGLPPFDG